MKERRGVSLVVVILMAYMLVMALAGCTGEKGIANLMSTSESEEYGLVEVLYNARVVNITKTATALEPFGYCSYTFDKESGLLTLKKHWRDGSGEANIYTLEIKDGFVVKVTYEGKTRDGAFNPPKDGKECLNWDAGKWDFERAKDGDGHEHYNWIKIQD